LIDLRRINNEKENRESKENTVKSAEKSVKQVTEKRVVCSFNFNQVGNHSTSCLSSKLEKGLHDHYGSIDRQILNCPATKKNRILVTISEHTMQIVIFIPFYAVTIN
jgi:hypothetical protein